MKAWWQHYRAAFTEQECAAILTTGMAMPPKDATVGHGAANTTNASIRRSTVRWLPRTDPDHRWIFDRIVINALEVNHNAFFLRLHSEPKLSCPHLQLTEYDAQHEQHYDWHEDNCWIPSAWSDSDRKLSCVVQLTPPHAYEGGKLQLERHPLPEGIFTLPGDMLFFPSHLRHKVTPVTRGTRHSLVAWFTGPRLS